MIRFVCFFLFSFVTAVYSQGPCIPALGTIKENIYPPCCHALADSSDTLEVCFTFRSPGSLLLFTPVPPANCDTFLIESTLYDTACNLIQPNAFGVVFTIPGNYYRWCSRFVCTGGAGYGAIWCPNYANLSALPVTWLYARVKRSSDQLLLEWATAAEVNVQYFEISASADARVWTHLVNSPAAGNSSWSHYYALPVPEYAYYRIQEVSVEGELGSLRLIANIQLEHQVPLVYDLQYRFHGPLGATVLPPGVYFLFDGSQFKKHFIYD